MVRSPSERSFFTNLGGISHSESIRRTIYLARKNAGKRRNLNKLPGQNSALLPENDKQQNNCFEVNEDNQRANDRLHISESEKMVENTIPRKAELAKTAKLEGQLQQESASERILEAECDVFLDPVGIAHMVEEKGRQRNPCVKKSVLSPSNLFKARPLPGGIWVENDLFASTVSTRGKNKSLQSMEFERTQNVVVLNEGFRIRKRRDLSTSPSITSGSHHTNTTWCRFLRSHAASPSEASSACRVHSHNFSPKPSKLFVMDKKQRALQKKIKKSNCFVKKAGAFSCHGAFSDKNENALSEGEGKIRLEREVERLEKQLQRRKTLAREIMDFLGLDPTQYYVDSEKDRTSESLGGSPDNAIMKKCFSPYHSTANTMGASNQTGVGDTLFTRQERWLETKEKRLYGYRMAKIMELMEGFTGNPLLSDTKESWERAKAAHEIAVRHQMEEETRRENAKGFRMQHVELNREKELEEFYSEAVKRKRSLKAGVDRGQQKAAIEKLSRPKAKMSLVQDDDERNEVLASNSELGNYGGETARKVYGKRDGPKQNGKKKLKLSAQLSYADMNDEQFARIMKSIGVDMNSR